MKARRNLSLDEIGYLIALAAVILGGWLYLQQPAIAKFPINDGGLFYVMIRAIQENGFRLPDYVHYNGLSIPFVYPPLGFYAGAGISSLLRIDPILVVQWMPASVLVLILIGIYGLARRLLNSRFEAGMATFLYAFTPRSMTWLIMGGGLTRSLGQLLLVLTVSSLYAAYSQESKKHVVWTILLGSLVVVTHPEATLHVVAVCLLIWLLKGRNMQGILRSAVIALGVVVVTAAWWLPLILKFGLAPFVSATQTGLHTSLALFNPLIMTFAEEPAMTIIAALGLVGLIACLAKRDYLLPAWLFLPFIVEPRGAATVSIIPLALLGSIALHEVIFPRIAAIEESVRKKPFAMCMESTAVKILFWYLAAFLFAVAVYAGNQLAVTSLSDANRSAFSWIADHTPAGSRFLVMTGDAELFCDPVQEWFPALTGMVSETTIQGHEWTSNGAFFTRVGQLQELQNCLQADDPEACVTRQAASSGLAYNYIYISKSGTLKQFCRASGEERRGNALISELTTDPQYTSAYRTQDVVIFSRGNGR